MLEAAPAVSAPASTSLRSLLTLAWPIIISRATQTVVSLSDTLMIAHLGASALAAVATGGLNAMTVLIFPMGITFIVQSYASQLFGKSDLGGARRYGWYGLLVALLTQALALLAWPHIDDALAWVNSTDEVRALMAAYLRVRLLSSGAAIGIEALNNYYGGLGRTRPGMVANLVAMLLNIAGNWLLIDGHLGAPRLGVVGAAWASSASTALAFLGFFGFFFLDRAHGVKVRLQLREVWRMLRFGTPSGFTWLFEFAAYVFFANVVVAGLGTAALAAMNAVMSITSVSFMPAFGLASAGAILVGQAIGGGQPDAVVTVVKRTALATTVWQGLAGLLCVLMPGVLIAGFAQGEGAAEVADIGARMLMISAAWQVFDALGMTVGEALRGAGDTFFPMVMRIALGWLVFVPGSYLTVTRLGWRDAGAASWFVIYLGLLALALWLRFRAGVWRRIELVDPTAAPS